MSHKAPALPAGLAGPASVPWSDALKMDALDYDEVCHLLGVRARQDQWNIMCHRTDEPYGPPVWRVGHIRPVGSKPLKCVCWHGPGCSLHLNHHGRQLEAEVLLIKWVCSGIGLSLADHCRSREGVKAKLRSLI